MPKTTSARTFTACWTCRQRNIRCDTRSPSCAQCARSRLTCGGYDLRLAWVDSETGYYEPLHRRTYPCELTWDGHPTWTMKEVEHLIRFAENKRCRCKIHQFPTPFVNFQADGAAPLSQLHKEAHEGESIGSPGTFGPEPLDVEALFISGLDTTNPIGNASPLEVDFFTLPAPWSLSRSWVPGGSSEDNELFHHHVSCLAPMMTPIDDDYNPWKSTYPTLAVQERTSSLGACSLFHGILAQSAFQRANLSQPLSSKFVRLATQHSGLALQYLRRSLDNPRANFSRNLAAMLTVTLADHCFNGQSVGLRCHLQGAARYVTQHLEQRPWANSHETWVITQSFVLYTLMSQIASPDSVDPDTADTLHRVFEDVTANPSFAYSMGSTPRLVKALYQARQLELELGSDDSVQSPDKPQLSVGQFLQASKILAELDAPLDSEIELFLGRSKPGSKPLTDQREFIASNLELFAGAVKIYLLRMVLHYPPSALADQVLRTLTAAAEALDPDRAGVSIWPIFMAATEAFTPEAQSLADQVLTAATKLGASNRATIHYIVKQIWATRQEAALQQGCKVGEVLVDWRKVSKTLGVDILLL